MADGVHPAARPFGGLFLLFYLVLAPAAMAQAQTGGAADPATLTQALAVRAQTLRQDVARDYRAGFRSTAFPDVAAKLERLDRIAWGKINPQIGWSFLLGTSPIAVAGVTGSAPLTAFYHPWSDTALVVAWRQLEGELHIQDLELLDAAIFRSPDLPAPNPDPAWTEREEFAPVAVAHETARVIQAFEELYPADFEGDWRRRLKWLSNDLFRGLNDSAVGLRLLRTMAMFAALRAPYAEQPAEMLRLSQAVRRFRTADLETLLAEAKGTLPETAAFLRSAPAGAHQTLVEISAVPSSSAGIVFFSPPDAPSFFLSLVVKGESAEGRIERIDLIEYASLTQLLQENQSP